MDFQTLARRELQALCKLNKIPANITNVAMVDALSSLEIVVGIEDFLKPSESSETTESSVESPARTEIMSPRVPRTGYRTSTRQKPVREESETVQTVTRTTRRGVRRQIDGEVEDSKTAAVPETPAPASTRRRAPAASASKNMETQLKESKEVVKVEESMGQEKKSVPVTPAVAVPSSRRKGPAASTTRRVNVKEESMFGRTYSTRRSARLAEVKVVEPSPAEKESEKLEKINSLSSQSFEEMLDDESSDGLNAVAEDSSLSESGVKSELLGVEKEKTSVVDTDMGTEDTMAIDAKTIVLENMGSNNMEVGVECKSELLGVEKEKTSVVDTDMGTEDTIAIDDKTIVLENMGSNNMEVDVIPSDIQNPSEHNKLENVETSEREMGSEETITEVITKTGADDDIASENYNPSEDSKLETVEKLGSHEDMDSIDVVAAEMENEVILNIKGEDDYPSVIENSSETIEQETVGTNEGSNNMEVDVIPSDIQNPSEHNKLENVETPERDMGSEETITEVIAKTGADDDMASENYNPSEDSKLGTVEKLSSHEDMDSVDVVAAEMENEVGLNIKGGDDYPSAIENSSETIEQETVGTDEESDADNSTETLKQENVGTFEDMDSDEKTAAVMESVIQENNVEKLNETEETNSSLAEDTLVDDVESQDPEKIESVVLNSIESDAESKNLEKNDSANQEENFEFPVEKLNETEETNSSLAEDTLIDDVESQEENFEFPVLCPIEEIEIGFANESVTNISADFSSFSLTSIPSSEVDAVVNIQVPSSKTTPLKKSAAKPPSQARKMAIVSDDKENIDQSGTKLQLTKDVGMKTENEKDDEKLKDLDKASLRQLTKMLKEKLQPESKVNTKVPKKDRPALQTLSSNSLAATEMGN